MNDSKISSLDGKIDDGVNNQLWENGMENKSLTGKSSEFGAQKHKKK